MGVEFSGTIESFGGQCKEDFKVGDEVFGLAYGGMHDFLSVSVLGMGRRIETVKTLQ